jgi:GAF domain-containing protein/DNA-binding CsgD family transcriptional regulator
VGVILVSDVPPDNDLPDGDRLVSEVIGELAVSRPSVRAILTRLVRRLSSTRPGTWLGVVMNRDPTTSLVVSADAGEPSRADYVQQSLTALNGPDRTRTLGLSMRVIETGRPLVIPRASYEEFVRMLTPETQSYLRDHPLPIRTIGLLIVPLRARGVALGTLGLLDGDAQILLGENETQWLQAVADSAGLVIENAQLYENAATSLERIGSMQSLTRALASSSDLGFTLKLILDQVTLRLPVDGADVLLFDESNRTFGVAASAGFQSTSMPEYRLSLDEGLPGGAITTRRIEMFNVADPFADARRRSLFAREGFKAYGAVPMLAQGKFLGALEVFHRSALEPDPEWLMFLDGIGNLAAIAVDSSVLRERTEGGGGQVAPAGVAHPAPDMTRIEKQILALLVEGASNREISADVHLSQNTVKFHVRQLLQKAEVGNRTELARKATQEGWL